MSTERLWRVQFGVDWGHEWPLWGPDEDADPSEPEADAVYPTSPEELGLSQGLARQLGSFYDFWETHYLFEKVWDSLEHCRHARAEADRLTDLVAGELRGRYTVVNTFEATFPCTAGLVPPR